MMFYLHTKFHDKWISSFRGVDFGTDGRTDGQTDTPRPAFAFGDAGNKSNKLVSYRFPGWMVMGRFWSVGGGG